MSRRQEWHRRARVDLATIQRTDARLARRIGTAIVEYAEHDVGDVLKLSGRGGEYRLRVGDWRVLFTLEDGGQVMLMERILNRRDAYR